jgi:ubiquinone/menaquinone biosynthesis C-methylase UbiE
MSSRGQANFVRLPAFAARLYASLTSIEAVQRQHQEIAADLVGRITSGRILDIGSGPGVLLADLHRLQPGLELHGLDISAAMVDLAKTRLNQIPVDLRVGDIRQTTYPAQSFDLVTCTGSFYLWDDPEKGLAEIHRLLKPGGQAILYETCRDYDKGAVLAAIQLNLRSENWLRRWLAPRFLLQQFSMTYTKDEIALIIARTPFHEHARIESITLGGLPAWLRIHLWRS